MTKRKEKLTRIELIMSNITTGYTSLHPSRRDPERLGLNPPRHFKKLRQRGSQILVHYLLIKHVAIQEIYTIRRPYYISKFLFL